MKFSLRWDSLILIISIVLVISSSLVVAPPPVPPLVPPEPAEAPTCTITNEGIEICDSLDNDCDGSIDEDSSCTSNSDPVSQDTGVTETSTVSSSSSGGSSGSKKGGGGSGGGSSSSGILFFSEPESSGTIVDESTLPIDSSDDLSTLSKESLELLDSSSNSQNNLESIESGDSINQQSDSKNIKGSSYTSKLFNNYRSIILGTIALVIIAGAILFVLIKKNSKSQNNNSNPDLTPNEINAVAYINKMRKNNYSEDQIKSSMKKSGWNDKQIDKLTKIKSK